MINAVPIAITKAARQMTLRHPNSLDASIYRKVFNRTNATGETLGGAPTLGGLGVLLPEDEDDYTYVELGDAKVLLVSKFEGNIDMSDRNDSVVPNEEMYEALIEDLPNSPFHFKKYDLVATEPGGGVVIAYEIMAIPTTINNYPFTTKYVIAPRDDLTNLTPWNGRD